MISNVDTPERWLARLWTTVGAAHNSAETRGRAGHSDPFCRNHRCFKRFALLFGVTFDRILFKSGVLVATLCITNVARTSQQVVISSKMFLLEEIFLRPFVDTLKM